MENNDIYEKTFIASSELFQGFRVKINILYINSLDDIVEIFLKELKNNLKKNNFENLLEKIKDNEWHIHSHSLEDILLNNEIFYVCNHCI